MLQLKNIGTETTLFLDRDGVLNKEKPGGYINNWQEFNWCDGALDALKILSPLFGKIIIVTNQRGVSKGETKLSDLHEIHRLLKKQIVLEGGRIDAIFFCTDIDDASLNRKPNPGMALQALELFPEINFTNAVMVGDKESDMKFGKGLGMATVFVSPVNTEIAMPEADAVYASLYQFATALLAGNL